MGDIRGVLGNVIPDCYSIWYHCWYPGLIYIPHQHCLFRENNRFVGKTGTAGSLILKKMREFWLNMGRKSGISSHRKIKIITVEGWCDASSGKELMDNKRQFELKAIFKNNLCEESGRDPPFVELGNDILAKKEWCWHFCIWKSLARSGQKLNSRERSREPLSFPFTSRREPHTGYVCLCPPFPYVKDKLGFLTKGVWKSLINTQLTLIVCTLPIQEAFRPCQITELAINWQNEPCRLILSFPTYLSWVTTCLSYILRLRSRQLRPGRHSVDGQFRDGKGRKGFWKVQEKAFPQRSVPRRKREVEEWLSGKFKKVHCILDDTGDVQMQAFQHHSFLTEASLPSSINSGSLPLASHQNNHLSADLLQLSKSRSWFRIPFTLPFVN